MQEVKVINAKKIDLKNEFISIGESRKDKIFTEHMIQELYNEYKELFLSFQLQDLQYTIKLKDGGQEIEFTPVRNIDKLAIRGILSM